MKNMSQLTASVIGGSGYAGGELVRLLLMHPNIDLTQVTSERLAGKFVKTTHPNLREVTNLKFKKAADLTPTDILFLALPHGVSMEMLPKVRDLAPVVIDLSSDFRLNNPGDYDTWYGHEHNDLDLLGKFVYGMPELHREEITTADWIASPEAWIALGTLTALEIVLGIDNIIFISILSGRLPEDQQPRAAEGPEDVREQGVPARHHALRGRARDQGLPEHRQGVRRVARRDDQAPGHVRPHLSRP